MVGIPAGHGPGRLDRVDTVRPVGTRGHRGRCPVTRTPDELRDLLATIGLTPNALHDLLTELIHDLIARREAEAATAWSSGLLMECRVDAYRVGTDTRVRLTHLPTGIHTDAATTDAALDELVRVLRVMEERYRGEPLPAATPVHGRKPVPGPVR